VLSPALSNWYADLHRTKGTEVLLGAKILQFHVSSNGEVDAIELSDKTISVGLVVIGIGVSANDSLARDAGIECDNGIVVDTSSRTNDPYVVAAGDCTVLRTQSGQFMRLESVQNAIEQGKSAAAALLGEPRPFTATPWFWSDQYDKKLQIAGLSAGANIWAIRGDMLSDSFSVYNFKDEKLLAVDSVNAAKDHLVARKLLDAGISPTVEQITDTNFNLSALHNRKVF
jgi:3-phenylpropionate/trans-cinnamate dioxygenase ferredoxin reductase subunit